jgi:peptidoglycan/xylan/chitin deacetylase (PgdA/CDA1 family)
MLNRRQFTAAALSMSAIGIPAAHAGGIPGLYWPDTFRGHVSFTFDDGPHPKYSHQIMDILAENDLKATFFVCGRRVSSWPDVVRRMHKDGHCIGNHTYTHPTLGTLTEAEITREFGRTERAINRALGEDYPIRYYRPPFGNPWFSSSSTKEEQKEKVRRVVTAQEGLIILWQLCVGDTRRDASDETILKRAKDSLKERKGGVYCMHDNNGRTVRALPKIITYLKEKEIRFATLEELINIKYFM